LLAREDLLWCRATKIAQQSLAQRFLVFPAELFENAFKDLLPQLQQNWQQRLRRPLPDSIKFAPDLYRRRWRIEDAFHTGKRLLGLSYLWTGEPLRWTGSPACSRSVSPWEKQVANPKGSINGIKLQVWATWLFYAVLVDLSDASADELSLPFDRISLEMVYRGFYHFSVAYDKGKATDPIKYFAAKENQDLGVVKSLRKPVPKLDLSPFPLPLLTNVQFS
jgi:hypothetical protein